MSAILSAEALNDFITPGVACIKPVETLPQATPLNPYEVTTEDQVAATEAKLQAAQISLTDCLACSGCVTSAEAVLVSLQSHVEVLSVLDSYPTLLRDAGSAPEHRVFVASISPQTRASLAAAAGKTSKQVGHMIDRLLLDAISNNGKRAFDYVIDTSPLLSVCLELASKEVQESLGTAIALPGDTQRQPVLTSECPGFICYLEKTHPEVLPHLSRLKSPQALLGTFLKSLLPNYLGENVQIYHVAVMPCFDKKLEASRSELTDKAWSLHPNSSAQRDVDCVITTRELLQLAEARGVDFMSLCSDPKSDKPEIPIPILQSLLGSYNSISAPYQGFEGTTGTSGGYLAGILKRLQLRNPGSYVEERQGRNMDVTEFVLLASDRKTEILRMARYYGFRNIQNLVRRLKPPKVRMLPGAVSRAPATSRAPAITRTARATAIKASSSGKGGNYCYVEVMACPGGCTNGGGQLKSDDPLLPVLSVVEGDDVEGRSERADARTWLAKVDEAYYSEEEEGERGPVAVKDDNTEAGGTAEGSQVDVFLQAWAAETGISLANLVFTTYHAVESDVGKPVGEMTTVQAAELAQKVGGGW